MVLNHPFHPVSFQGFNLVAFDSHNLFAYLGISLAFFYAIPTHTRPSPGISGFTLFASKTISLISLFLCEHEKKTEIPLCRMIIMDIRFSFSRFMSFYPHVQFV